VGVLVAAAAAGLLVMADHQGVIVEEDCHHLAELRGDSVVQAVHYRPAESEEVVLLDLDLVAEVLLLVVPEKPG
jgi:hypothetical protein